MTAPVLTLRKPASLPSALHAAAWEPIDTALLAMRTGYGVGTIDRLASPYFVGDAAGGWTPADALTSGEALTTLLAVGARRWRAQPHAAATLAWKSYSYWASLPIVLGWAAARRVPLLTADQTLVRLDADDLVFAGANPSWAVLASDPLASVGHPSVRVAHDETALLAIVRETLLDRHLDPLLESIRDRVRIGRRTLLGSVASGVAWAMIRASDALPGSTQESIEMLLGALRLDDLVDMEATGAGLSVRRRTCCLAFTTETPKICTGCCIR
jgi:hypothetical protein